MEAGDDIQEALSKTISTTVNYDFNDVAPISNSAFDDIETIAGRHNWQENVMFGGELAKGTSYLDTGAAAFFAKEGIDTGTQMLALLNNPFQSDVAIETREFSVGFNGEFSVSWWHYFVLEKEWDGGVVEVSVNGGEWADVTTLGGKFDTGYTAKLQTNKSQALSDREAFTGSGFGAEVLHFGDALNGNTVKFRFRLGSDVAVREDGWFIDNIRFNNVESSVFSEVVAGDFHACENRLPIIASVTGENISERVSAGGSFSTGKLNVVASDADGEALTYSWTQKSGPTAALNGADKAEAVFTAPQITENATLVFEVVVSDGKVSVSKEVSVDIRNVSDQAPEVAKSSSGGAAGLLSLLLVPFAMMRRKKRA